MLYLLCSLQYTNFTVLPVNLSVHCPSTTLANQKSATGFAISYLYSFWVQFKAFSQVLSLFNFLLKENHVLKIKHTLLTLCSDTHSKSLTHGRESVFTKRNHVGWTEETGSGLDLSFALFWPMFHHTGIAKQMTFQLACQQPSIYDFNLLLKVFFLLKINYEQSEIWREEVIVS